MYASRLSLHVQKYHTSSNSKYKIRIFEIAAALEKKFLSDLDDQISVVLGWLWSLCIYMSVYLLFTKIGSKTNLLLSLDLKEIIPLDCPNNGL